MTQYCLCFFYSSLVLIFIMLISVSATLLYQQSIFSTLKKDKKAFGSIIKTIPVMSHLTCVHRCKLNTYCDSIDYNNDMKQCTLIKKSSNGVARINYQQIIEKVVITSFFLVGALILYSK